MRNRPRIFLAIAIAPLAVVPAVFFAVLAVHLGDLIQIDMLTSSQAEQLRHAMGREFEVAFPGVLVGWVLAVVFGVPAFLMLRLANLDQPVPCALIGAVFGMLLGTGFGHEVEPLILVVMTSCGASVAAAFCRIANKPQAPLRYFE